MPVATVIVVLMLRVVISAVPFVVFVVEPDVVKTLDVDDVLLSTGSGAGTVFVYCAASEARDDQSRHAAAARRNAEPVGFHVFFLSERMMNALYAPASKDVNAPNVRIVR
jgi:hypothetical protein